MSDDIYIPFNKAPVTGKEISYITDAIDSMKLSGDRFFGLECQTWFEKKLGVKKALITPSCTHALELAAILLNIGEGDEVIMPSYTFVSTANPFLLRGAKIIFVDIRKDTMNIDESLIENAITKNTKVIVPVHYAGISCEMDTIMDIANRHGLFVVEDAAQGVNSFYKGKPLGTIGHLSAFSFHETKNYTSGGEGGLLLINDESFIQRAEIIREKGTNRSQFFRGMVDKYSWVDVGSSYLPSEIQSAYLMAQLEFYDIINDRRKTIWNKYYKELSDLYEQGLVELPICPKECIHNAHMFYIKLKNIEERTTLIDFLKEKGIVAVFHYIPLHSSEKGCKSSLFYGSDINTTTESERLLRLPLFYNMTDSELDYVISNLHKFFKGDYE